MEIEYYRRRLQQEEEAVKSASSNAARQRHRELAEAYRLRTRPPGALPELSDAREMA